VIGRDTISEGVRPAGIVGDVAANGTGRLAARIRRVEKAIFGDSFRYLLIDYTGLDEGDAICRSILECDPGGPTTGQCHLSRHGAAGKSVPDPRGTMGTLARCAAHHLRHLINVAGTTTISGMT
jgi:hypothetical protein